MVGKNGPSLSHLAFANDLILFVKASMDQVDAILACLDLFCESSSEKVSKEKTRIFFSHNVHWSVREEINNGLGFQRIDDLGRVSKTSYKYIVERVQQRISIWKNTNLSFVGRLTLSIAALSSIPMYVMDTVVLPRSICDKVNQICISILLLGDTTNERRVHWVSDKSSLDIPSAYKVTDNLDGR
ncbi:putative ribonuclease H protein [Glycine soja]